LRPVDLFRPDAAVDRLVVFFRLAVFFRPAVFRLVVFFRPRGEADFRLPLGDSRGTRAPFSRASLSPMAIACLRLVTLAPELERSVPRLRRRMALSTSSPALSE
jgi:hypothetical protein